MSDFTSTFRVPLAWEPYRLSGVAGSQYGLFHPLLRQPRGRYSVGTHQLESWDVAEIGKFGGKPLTLDEVHRIKNMLWGPNYYATIYLPPDHVTNIIGVKSVVALWVARGGISNTPQPTLSDWQSIES